MSRKAAAAIVPIVLVVGLALNYVHFGPLGGLVMAGLEFTVAVFVLLGCVLFRSARSND